MPGPGYSDLLPGLGNPAMGGFTVTPNDGADLPTPTRSIYVGGVSVTNHTGGALDPASGTLTVMVFKA